MMATRVASLPVPAVVGTATTGTLVSTVMGFASTYLLMGPGLVIRMLMALAASMLLPPPMPMITSTFSRRAISPASSTTLMVGSDMILLKQTHWMPAFSRLATARAGTPAASTPGSKTQKAFLLPSSETYSPRWSMAPAPK